MSFMLEPIQNVEAAGKVAGVIAGLNVIPFVPPEYGLFIFARASILKDVVNLIEVTRHSDALTHGNRTLQL